MYMCVPLDLRFVLFGYCGGLWLIFLYQTYKNYQRRQKNYKEYVDRFGDDTFLTNV